MNHSKVSERQPSAPAAAFAPAAAAGGLLAVASLYPQTVLSVLSALGSAAAFAALADAGPGGRPVKRFFWAGAVFHAFAFYWLPETITRFGGFPAPVSYLLFAVFCALSSVQFVLVGWICGRAGESALTRASLILPAAWLLAELLTPRLFPWAIGHAFAGWSSIAAHAEVVGVPLLSALMLWLGSAVRALVLSMLPHRPRRIGLPIAAAVVVAVLAATGLFRNKQIEALLATAPAVEVGLIQGNLEVLEKRDAQYLRANLDRYRRLSRQSIEAGADFILWPETVVNEWTPEDLPSIAGSRFDPFPAIEVPLLYGTLSFRPRTSKEIEQIVTLHPSLDTPEQRRSLANRYFNSAVVVTPGGTVRGFYHKRVLMPFGEYIPLADRFPFLKTISPQTGDFSEGDLLEPIAFPAGEQGVRASVLICYEDLVPALSREAVQRGANLLVNITNDAWYGETAAPYQHHLLALWRAVETRRYLLRVTNTGLTAIVDPFGRTVAQLDIFMEGWLNGQVRLLELETIYSRIGDWPAWILGAALVGIALGSGRRRA